MTYFSANPIIQKISGTYQGKEYGLFETPEWLAQAPVILPINGKVGVALIGASVMLGCAKQILAVNTNQKLNFHNLCDGGAAVEKWTENSGNNKTWTNAINKLTIPASQVQVIITMMDKKEYDIPTNFENCITEMEEEWIKLIQNFDQKFSALKQVIIVSRPYSDWAQGSIQYAAYVEPNGYWNGWSNKEFLQGKAPAWKEAGIFLTDGAYLWASGETQRTDGFQLLKKDFQAQNIHMKDSGYKKCANFILTYLTRFDFAQTIN